MLRSDLPMPVINTVCQFDITLVQMCRLVCEFISCIQQNSFSHDLTYLFSCQYVFVLKINSDGIPERMF